MVLKLRIFLFILCLLNFKVWAGEILLSPIGEINQETLEFLKENLKKIFKVEVVIGEKISFPDYAFNSLRGQFNSRIILENYKKQKRTSKVLLIFDQDLYVEGLNFVFGQADILKGVAIISLKRLHQSFYGFSEDENLFKERVLKEAVHELGHLYGLGHCSNPDCVMHFSNSLLDTDRKSFHFCSRCKKVLEILSFR